MPTKLVVLSLLFANALVSQAPTAGFVPAPGSPYAVGPMVGRPVTGDVNGDGHLDVVVACGTCCGSEPDPKSGLVCVLLGDGHGGLTLTNAGVPVGPSVRKVALGDLDGDGDLDVVAAEHDRHTLTVLLNDGKGTLTPRLGEPPVLASEGRPHTHDVVLVDVDRDQHLDVLATLVNAHGVAVLLGNGDGSFAAAPGSPFRVRAPYDALAVGDFDADGAADVVYPSVGGHAIGMLRGDGKGGFADATNVKVTPRPGYVIASDLDGDGDLDLVATHDDEPIVDVLLNDGKAGFVAAPGAPLEVEVEGFLWGIAAADLDADGKIDLALGNAAHGKVSLLRGDGKGGFSGSETLPAGRRAGYVAAADLNGDGMPDLVVGSYTSGDITVWLAQARAKR